MAPNTDEIPTNTNTVLNINMSYVSKLTATNYLMWSLQVHALLDGYGLAGHLDGTTVAPPPTTLVANITTPNPEFVHWTRQNKLIYSGLIGAISTPLQSLVSCTTTASQIWTTLASTYAKPSRGHIKQLKTQLKDWTKGNKSIDDQYLHGLTTRMDQLAILGKPLEHEDQVEMILEGLPEEYKAVVDQIEGKDTPPSITEVHERLLNREANILSASTAAASSPFPVSANVVQQRNHTNTNSRYNNNNRSRNNTGNTNSNWQQSSFTPRSDNRAPRPYLGKCQYCNVQGHSALSNSGPGLLGSKGLFLTPKHAFNFWRAPLGA